jgi:hypothetical protein
MPSQWIDHVKAYASKHSMSYRDALKCPDCKQSYKKSDVKGKGNVTIPVEEPEGTGLRAIARKMHGKGSVKEYVSPTAWSEYTSAVVKGRNDYPPKMREILKKYGDKPIVRMQACRTPVPGFITSALNMASLGEFNKRFANMFHDALFHLDLRIEIEDDTGKTKKLTQILLEKNEVLNAVVKPKKLKDTECVLIQNVRKPLTINQMLQGAKKIQGQKFFKYSASNNNCQDFIMALLKGVNAGTEENYKFVKQNTKELFEGLPFFRKLTNTVTDIGAAANTFIEGKSMKHDVVGGKLKLKIPKSISRAVQSGISKILHMLSKKKIGKKSVLDRMTGMYSDDDMQISDRAPAGFDWRLISTEELDDERMRELDRLYGTPMTGTGNRPSRRVVPVQRQQPQRLLPFPLPIDEWISLSIEQKYNTLDSYSNEDLRRLIIAIRSFLNVTGLSNDEALRFNLYRQVGADYIRIANALIDSRQQQEQTVDLFYTPPAPGFPQQIDYDDADDMEFASALFKPESIYEGDEDD